MRRIAYCTPLNPVGSGISDYSEELLPELGRYFDITVIVDDDVRPTNADLLRSLPVERAGRLLELHRRRPFDAVIYHMGNSPAHSTFYDLLGKLPGIVVLHDYVLHHLMLWRAANVERKLDRYVATMEQRYGSAGAETARQMARGRLPESAFDYPLVEDVVERSTGLIAHSRYVADRVAALRPALPVAVVPMGVPLPPLGQREAARARLGLPADALIWASFGHINPYKRIEPALRAFRRLRADWPQALYVLVGSSSPNYDVAGVVARLGLTDAVRITGHVPAADFTDYVAAADVCLNLRFPSAGETSASLLRLLAGSRPVMVSATGSFTELPAGIVAQVDVDASEEALIEAYGRAFARFPALAAAVGEHARRYVATEHTLQRAAAGYAAFLAHLGGWEQPKPARPPLWELAQEQPSHAAPAPATGDQSTGILLQSLGAAAAGLGLVPDDVQLLDRAAARLQGLV